MTYAGLIRNKRKKSKNKIGESGGENEEKKGRGQKEKAEKM